MDQRSSAEPTLLNLGQDCHASLIFEDRREQLAAGISFIRQGLQRGEKCIWGLSNGHRRQILALLGDTYVDVDETLRSGALELRPRAEIGRRIRRGSDLRSAVPVPDALCEAARAQGFSAVRLTGEIPASDPAGGGLPILLGHGSRLNAFLAHSRCSVLCVYRAAQEALHNMVKHSNSPRATLTLSGSRSTVRFQVTDPGVGFEPDSVRHRGSLGIVSMEERVRLRDGAFTLRSRPGEGAGLEVRIPLAPESI